MPIRKINKAYFLSNIDLLNNNNTENIIKPKFVKKLIGSPKISELVLSQ